MPEPREPIMPPEPVCTCHGWPGSVCDARGAAARVRFGRAACWSIVAAWVGAAVAMVLRAYLREPTASVTLAAALCGHVVGMSVTIMLSPPAAGGTRG